VYVSYNTPAKLQVILPGETAVPGFVNGKSGKASQQTADEPFNITVNLTDDYWNRVLTGAMPLVTLGSTDVYWSTPTARALSNGTVSFSAGYAAKLVTASTHTITATGGSYTAGVSSPVCVNPNVPVQLLVLAPGETQVNGKNSEPAGRSGAPVAQTSGQSFTVTVYAADRCFNLTPGVNGTMTINTSDTNDIDPGNKAMTNGVATALCQINTALPATVSAVDNDAVPRTSEALTILPL